MGKVPGHKGMNRLPINFQNENTINCYVGLLKIFSKGKFEDVKILSKQEVWKLSFPNEKYREEEFLKLLLDLTRSFDIKTRELEIHGSIFGVEYKREMDSIKIAVSQIYSPYLFSQKDIELIVKAKNKEKMNTEELDYWDTVLRDKKKELFLLDEAEIRGVRGKYAKRLYMLLKQFENTGFFSMGIEEFREVMQVPVAYSLGLLNRDVIRKSKIELEKKNIFKFPEETKGKGRRKIDKIEILFQFIGESIPFKNKKLKPAETIIEAEVVKEIETVPLTSEEEERALTILGNQSIFKEMKKKSETAYWNTLKMALK